MAFKKMHTINVYGQSFVFNDAYHQITYLSGNKDMINIQVTIYTDNKKEQALDHKVYILNPNILDNAKNFIKQGYEYLKTTDEYKDAIDILEPGQSA